MNTPTLQDIQKLIEMSRDLGTAQKNTLKAYLKGKPMQFSHKEGIVCKDNGEYAIAEDVDIDDLEKYVWVRVMTDSFNDVWEDVRVIGIVETDSPYSGGVRLFYVDANDDNIIKDAFLTDVSNDNYDDLLELLTMSEDTTWSEFPDEEENEDI